MELYSRGVFVGTTLNPYSQESNSDRIKPLANGWSSATMNCPPSIACIHGKSQAHHPCRHCSYWHCDRSGVGRDYR